jgi:hypothetical protein
MEKGSQSFANVSNFIYLGTAVTNQNDILEETSNRESENLGNIQSRRFSFHLFSTHKNKNVKIYNPVTVSRLGPLHYRKEVDVESSGMWCWGRYCCWAYEE